MTNLFFTKDSKGIYKTSFDSAGEKITLQLSRVDSGFINFYANIGTMKPMSIASYGKSSAGKNFLIVINVPSGVTVTVESETEVLSGGFEG